MWKTIREILAAITGAMSRTTSALAYGTASIGDWLIERWSDWARLVSGTSYRPAPVTDLRDEVTDITARPDAPTPDRDDVAELGRRVKLAAQAVLDGSDTVPDDLPSDVQVWLLARLHFDLMLTVRASDLDVGRHMTGERGLRGPSGSEVPMLDARRDERIVVMRLERMRHRVVEEYERQAIREAFPTQSERASMKLAEERRSWRRNGRSPSPCPSSDRGWCPPTDGAGGDGYAPCERC